MKKTLTLLALITFAISVNASELKDTRKLVAEDLNETVARLKDYFKPVDEDLSITKTESLDLYKDAKKLKENSLVDESNPTALKHARGGTIQDCDANNQELNWTGTKWECQDIEYTADCQPTDGEEKVDDGKGGKTCVLQGNYANKSLGWGICDDKKGERETQVGCMFTKTVDNKGYQVDSNLCSNDVDRFKQACGENGDSSSCSCPTGYKYNYNSGNPTCSLRAPISNIHGGGGWLNSITDISDTVVKWRHEDGARASKTKIEGRSYRCEYKEKRIKFDFDKSRVSKVTLTHIFIDDSAWLYINDNFILLGANKGDGARKHMTSQGFEKLVLKSFSSSTGERKNTYYYPAFKDKGNNSFYPNCELNGDYVRNLNVDIPLDYLKDGENELYVQWVIGGYGNLRFEIDIEKTVDGDSELPLPECKI